MNRIAVLGMSATLVVGGVMAGASAPAKGKHPLPAVTAKMQEYVERKEAAGVVTLVTDAKNTLHLDAVGLADREANKPIKTDSIFWIASMSKPITGTAVLMMQDEGKLSVDDPISKYLPELGRLRTADGMKHTVTIRHLLTHTSGMSEITSTEARDAHTLADAVALYAARPLQFKPGSEWRYSQSSINTAARIVEVVSGQSTSDFLEQRLFKPLGMRDTAFYLSEKQNARLAKSYARTPEGELKEAANPILYGKSARDRDRFPAANGGLFSTAPDYARFARMILNDGSVGGKRYLRPESVRLMTTVQSGDLTTGFTPGNGWGLGWCVTPKPQGVSGMLSPGTFGHGGAFGTQAWMDPVTKRAYILMVQRSNFPNSDASELRRDFQQTAVNGLGASASRD